RASYARLRRAMGVGTAFNASERLACAVPTNGIDGSCSVHGGHGAREELPCGNAVPAPLPTLQVLNRVSQISSSKIHRVAACHPPTPPDERAVRLRQGRPGVTEAVDDRIAAIATEILERDL